MQRGVITPDQLEIALTEQKKSGELLGKIMVRLGFVTASIIRDVISGVTGQQSVTLEQALPDADAIALIEESMARRLTILPLTFEHGADSLTVATTDPFNVLVLDKIRSHVGEHINIVPLLAVEAEIEKTIDSFYGFDLSVDGILNEIETGEIDHQSLETVGAEYSQPVVRLVNALLLDAVKCGASDIHFEPEEGFLRFRYRIDGVLRQIRSLHKNYWAAMAVRIKIMSGMDIAEMRAPQDGSISLIFSGRKVNFRVSTLPTVHGENIVLRIFDRQRGIISLNQLGFDAGTIQSMQRMLAKPEGITLVTGPTGSGKTTTLYAMLDHLNTEAVNIMTLEDPVEYPMALVRQTSINETARLSFASGIRSLMRQDPDIILVGEVRDKDTASMALRAAMTGHRVFSTLHSNSAVGAVPRLIDMGVDAGILAGNISGIIAQRLARRLCMQCRVAYSIDASERTLLGLEAAAECPLLYRAKGCPACNEIGYKGRLALVETLVFDDEMDRVIVMENAAARLSEIALRKGVKTLLEAGVGHALDGSSSLAEITRVIDLSQSVDR